MYGIADLQTFIAVARQEGMAPAARRLGISVATTSHRIAKLEAALGVTLFHRNSRAVSLSEEGLIFLERVEAILDDLQRAEMAAGARDSALRGHLRVTMSPWILSRFVLPHLAAFQRRHPDLTIDILSVDRYVPLVQEGFDCAVRVGALEDSSLVARRVSDNDRIICASPAYLHGAGEPKSIDHLREVRWVCLPWQLQIDVVAQDGRARRLALPRSLTVSNSDTLTEAAVQGLGLAVKSRLAVRQELADGRLVEVMRGALSPAEAPIWFVSPPAGRNSRKTIEFGRLAQEAFAAARVRRDPEAEAET